MSAYEAVCFDLDRTLCVGTQDPESVLTDAFERAGCDPFCTHESLRELVPAVSSAETDIEFHVNLFEHAAHRQSVDPSIAPALAESYLECYDPTAVRLRDGGAQVLEHARDRASAVGLITNGGPALQRQKLEALDIDDVFDVTVFVDPEAGIPPKPDPRPFERALGAVDVAPDRALHVGDAHYADVAGANAVGMDSAWLAAYDATPDAIERTAEPTYELASLSGLSALL